MEKEQLLLFYKEYEEKISAYELALKTISFDQSTIAPKAGNAFRNKMTSILNGELFSYMVKEEHLEQLEALYQMDDIDPIVKESLSQRLRLLRDIRILPKAFYVEYKELLAQSENVWEEAKEKHDYKIFEPYLIKVIEKTKEKLAYRKSDKTPYESLLDDFEAGMTIEKYDQFFQLIKDKLVPLIHEIQEKGRTIDDAILHEHFPAEKQAEFMEVMKDYMNFDHSKCYMGVSMHPYTSKFFANDTRLTTAYEEDFLTSSIFSIIHEYGHALYGMQVDQRFDGTILSDNMSMGIHESQSRLLENCLARTKGFWVKNYPLLQKQFPKQLNDVSLDEFMDMVNISYPSLIRTNADELTYPLHILIRYEIEKAIFNDNISLDHLNDLWADKYEEYLGIRPKHDSEGILQDVHWSDASFGYFPTYALGSAFAAQFYQQMRKDIDVDKALSDGEFHIISNWLKENIHQYGSYLDSNALLHKVCGSGFDPTVFIDYLTDKYRRLYHLS